jgi:hypothetical protein
MHPSRSAKLEILILEWICCLLYVHSKVWRRMLKTLARIFKSWKGTHSQRMYCGVLSQNVPLKGTKVSKSASINDERNENVPRAEEFVGCVFQSWCSSLVWCEGS